MKTHGHQKYRLKDGTLVPGVTTALNMLAKPALITWANRMGLKGIDTAKYKDEMAAIGTLTHDRIESDLLGSEPPNTDDYSKKQIDMSDTCLIKYYDWRKQHVIKNVMVEKQLVSEEHRYGGTPDIYCLFDDVWTLLDIKTANGIYDEMKIQTASYENLLTENDYPVERVKLVRFGKDDLEDFEVKDVTNLPKWFKAFLDLLDLYQILKKGVDD